MKGSGSEESDEDRWLVWTLAVAAVAFVLGVVGLAMYHPEPPLDLVYHALQLFVLGSDPLSAGGPYNLPLEIARILAPATTIYGIFRIGRTILGDRLRRRAVARTVGHAVVTGDSPASLVIAANLRADGTKVVFVGSDDGRVARRQGIPVVGGDPRDLTTLRAAGLRGATVLFACAPQTSTNAAVVLAAGRIQGRTQRLDALARVSSDELVEALRVRQLSNATRRRRVIIDFFSLEDIAARQLVNRYQPIASSVGIMGFETFGRALLRTLVRRSDAAPQSIEIFADEVDKLSDFVPSGEQTPNRKIRFRSRQETSDDALPDWVFVCLADEDDALNTALRLTRVVSARVVLCLYRESPFGQALKETPILDIFGVLDASCFRNLITDDAIVGRTARAIHQRYIDSCSARGDTPESNPSMRPWAELDPSLQDSNLAQAEHLGIKLAAIDCRLAVDRPDLPRFEFRDGEVDKLARLEHVRWMEERRVAGLVYGPVRTATEHPDMRDWPELSEESKGKDLDAVRHLPALLAGAGLLIQRR